MNDWLDWSKYDEKILDKYFNPESRRKELIRLRKFRKYLSVFMLLVVIYMIYIMYGGYKDYDFFAIGFGFVFIAWIISLNSIQSTIVFLLSLDRISCNQNTVDGKVIVHKDLPRKSDSL
jgi:hypothetical protein